MHLLLCADDSESELCSELSLAFTRARVTRVRDLVFEADFAVPAGKALPHLAYVRQFFPEASTAQCESIRGWAALLYEHIARTLLEGRPWRLHIAAHYGQGSHRMGARAWHTVTRLRAQKHKLARSDRESVSGATESASSAGHHRCGLIQEALIELLRKKRRHVLHGLQQETKPFTYDDSLVQLLLITPDHGYVSIAQAPVAFVQRHLLSPYPKGEVPVASDKAAPSRAFAKLLEAELRLGRHIAALETCVDLGASPGSWTYVAAQRGARIESVDRAPLRDDLMSSRHVRFHAGDAFKFKPAHGPVDWLLCDVIAPPERTAELLLSWLRQKWCRNFVVTLKIQGAQASAALANLKKAVPLLCRDFYLTRLSANKKEVCAFGCVD